MAIADAVKTKPINFDGPFIPKLLDGSKSQTRRIMKPQPTVGRYGATHPTKPSGIIGKTAGQLGQGDYHVWYPDRGSQKGSGIPLTESCMYRLAPECPYGEVGDRLWVKETWRPASWSAEGGWGEIQYRSDGSTRQVEADWTFGKAFPGDRRANGYRPSIHMPRWASRITLEITDVRVERLLDISEADKLAEGATPEVPFGTIWRKLHTKPGERFEDSSWVWALSFRRVV